MDSPDDDIDVDAELDAWLDKQAAEQGIDPNERRANELEAILEWQKNQTLEGFEKLYAMHEPLIFGSPRPKRFLSSTTLPKQAVRSSLIRSYVSALQDYDPAKGANFNTHYNNNWVGRTGRFINKYTNVGRIPEDRAGLINLLQQQEASLLESLGRPPTDNELADDMLLAAQDIADLRNRKINPKVVGTLRKEIRPDWSAEGGGGAVVGDRDSDLRQKIVFMHGSLNPEQQLVLEHTVPGFGKPVFGEDDEAIGQATNMSPQKVRAIKAQIKKRIDKLGVY